MTHFVIVFQSLASILKKLVYDRVAVSVIQDPFSAGNQGTFFATQRKQLIAEVGGLIS